MERVPAGATFCVQFVINVFDENEAKNDLELLLKGIKILENDYLGGSGTRGYEMVKFKNLPKNINDFNDYKEDFILIDYSKNN